MEMYFKYKKGKRNAKYAILGYPGVGGVGMITVSTIAKSTQAEVVGEIVSSTLYPARADMIEEGLVSIAGTRLIYLKDSKTVLVYGQHQPKSPYRHISYVLDVLKEEFGVREIVGIGGYSDPNSNIDDSYMYAADQKIINKYKNVVRPGPVGGAVFGVLAVLPNLSKINKIDGWVMLKTVKNPDGPVELDGIKAVIQRLDKIYNLKIDYTIINKDFQEIENMKNQLYKQIQEHEDEATRQYIR